MKQKWTRKLAFTLAMGCGAGLMNAATLEDIQYWVGSGTNRAAMVIDWGDGKAPQSLLWGYRWNGSATGFDMFKAVVAADPRLFTHLGQFVWGTAIFGIGYDLNRSDGYQLNPSLVFDSGGLAIDTGSTNANDARISSDNADHYLEGWSSGFWAYYLKESALADWTSAVSGAEGRLLKDGSWDGYSFAPGFISSIPAEPFGASSTPFALEVVAAQGPFGGSPYDDPRSVLGRPSTDFYDPFGGMSGGAAERRVKLVDAAYNLDLTQAHKLITTLEEGSAVVVRFEQPIQNDSAHPYGIDFLVFGNSFYASAGMVNESSDMNTLLIAGAGLYEPMKVSVSPGYTGALGQEPTNPATWTWYRYDHGPYADTAFPTQAYQWDRANSTWSPQLMDFTKPVNPVFGSVLDAGGLSAADGIDLYDGAAGGTGFDLADSGFSAIQYVKIEGLANYAGGEVDAISAVRPMFLGDSLSIAPANLTNGSPVLHFQRPGLIAENALTLTFKSVSEAARVATLSLADSKALAAYGNLLGGGTFKIGPILGSNSVTFQADLRIGVQPNYRGDGKDLVLLHQDGTNWGVVAFSYDSAAAAVLLPGVTNSSTLAVVQVLPPEIRLNIGAGGVGSLLTTVKVPALPGFTYKLERTGDLDHWEEVASASPVAVQTLSLTSEDSAKSAFYRIRMSRR